MTALPLADLPMKAVRKEINCLYEREEERLAELTYAKAIEKCYAAPLSWSTLEKAAKEPYLITEDTHRIFLDDTHSKQVIAKAFLKCVSTKVNNNTHWALAIIRVEIAPAKKKGATFAYYTVFQQQECSI